MKTWFAAAAALFAAGDYAGILMPQYFSVYAALAVVFAVLMAAAARFKPQTYSAAILALIFFTLCGMAAGSKAMQPHNADIKNYIGKKVTVYGNVDLLTLKKREKGTGFILECTALQTGSGKLREARGNIRVFVQNAKVKDFTAGSAAVTGTLKSLNSFANPGSFNSENWNLQQGLQGRMSVKQAALQVMGEADIRDKFFLFALGLRQKITDTVGGEAGAVLCGMALGGYDGLSEATREAFSVTGLAHILSVSGTHMALVAGFLILIIGRRGKAQIITVLLLLFLYALLCGGSAPVWRSFIMSAVALAGAGTYKKAQNGNIFCAAAVLLLIYNPLWLLDAGFQLSFAATGGLIFIYPQLKERLQFLKPVLVREGFAITLAAQLASLPLLLWHFNQLSLVTFAANILLVPAMEILVIAALAGLCLPFAGTYLIYAAGIFMQPLLNAVSFLAALPAAAVNVPHLPAACFVLYYIMLAALFNSNWFSKTERRYTAAICLAGIIVLAAYKIFTPQPFTVHFMDVGQGDAALVQTTDGHNIIVDCGGLQGNFDTGSRIIVPYLRYLGVEQIDLLALSHGHHDHAGGAAGLARLVKVNKLLLPQEKPSEDVQKLLHYIKPQDILEAAEGSVYMLGKCRVEVLASGKSEGGGNESSVIMRIAEPEGSILFTGDADENIELAAAAKIKPADVLKVAHHGSNFSSSPLFLKQAKPRLAVISVGADNRYGHPGRDAVQRLQGAGAKVLCTDKMGAVKVCFDEGRLQWYSYRYDKEFF